jgi:hypothetical protein
MKTKLCLCEDGTRIEEVSFRLFVSRGEGSTYYLSIILAKSLACYLVPIRLDANKKGMS